MFADEGLQDSRLWLLVWPSDISPVAGKSTAWCCSTPEPSEVPVVLQGSEAEGQEQGAQAQGCPSPGWVMVWHLHPIHPLLPIWGGGSPCPQLPPSRWALGQDHGVSTHPSPLPCPPAALGSPIPPPLPSPVLPLPSLCFSFSLHLLLSFPPLFSFLLPSPLSLPSYLIPPCFSPLCLSS